MIVVMLLAIGFGTSNNKIKVFTSPFFASHQLSHLEELVTHNMYRCILQCKRCVLCGPWRYLVVKKIMRGNCVHLTYYLVYAEFIEANQKMILHKSLITFIVVGH